MAGVGGLGRGNEVERTLSPLECARRKARIACEITGRDLGLGSEGSFGGGPDTIVERLELEGLLRRGAAGARSIVIEPDLRAMHCPERQVYIRQAAQQLAQRLQSRCPQCGAADFWPVDAERGLPCAGCGIPTALPVAFIRRCHACHHHVREPCAAESAEPGDCPWCNP
jgi:hypothetical protein